MSTSKGQDKKRVIVDYNNITSDILELFTDRYPYGYDDEDIIKFKNAKGETVKAVPFETSDTRYLIKVSVEMDRRIEAFLDDDEDDADTVSESTPPAIEEMDEDAVEEDED
jgi:DNA-directed RNA polymerase subunit delta